MKASQLRIGDHVAVGNHRDGIEGYCQHAVVAGFDRARVNIQFYNEQTNTLDYIQDVAPQSIVGMWEEKAKLNAERDKQRKAENERYEVRKALKLAKNKKVNEALRALGSSVLFEEESAWTPSDNKGFTTDEIALLLGVDVSEFANQE